MLLATIPITTAVSAKAYGSLLLTNGAFESAIIQGNFVYGSGGTTWSAWLQTTFDQGNTWVDALNFSGTTVNFAKIVNLSALTAVTTAYTPTNGTLSANTVANSGTIIGNMWQVLLTTTGTYAATSLRIDIVPRGPFGGSAL